MTPVGFQLDVLAVPQRTENAEKARLSRYVFYIFLKGERQILSLKGRKNQSNVLTKFAEARKLPFYMELNGTKYLCAEPNYLTGKYSRRHHLTENHLFGLLHSGAMVCAEPKIREPLYFIIYFA